MSPSLNKQTNTKSHKREEQRLSLYLAFFWEKKLAKKKTWCVIPVCQWLSKSNCQMNKNRRNFFFCQMEKSSEWFYPIRQLFHEFFQQLFQLDSHLSEVSQTPVSFSKLFFSYHCHTLAKIWKKILWTLWKHTSYIHETVISYIHLLPTSDISF